MAIISQVTNSANQIVLTHATNDPDATLDASQNYFPGSTWINDATGAIFACENAANGAALWSKVGNNPAPVEQNSRVLSQFDSLTSALAAIPGLVASLEAGGVYKFEINLFITAHTGGGHKIDLNGGSATAKAIDGAFASLSGTGNHVRVDSITSLTSSSDYVSGDSVEMVTVKGMIVCNAPGTFAPEFAQHSGTGSGLSSVRSGSNMNVKKIA